MDSMRRLEEDHIWLRALADLQSIKDYFEEAIRHINGLDIWRNHDTLKDKVLSRLFVGQKHLIVVLYYMYLTIDKSPLTALKYLKWIKEENVHVDNFEEVIRRFDQACESSLEDECFVDLTLNGLDEVNVPLSTLLAARADNSGGGGCSDPEDLNADYGDEVLGESSEYYDIFQNTTIGNSRSGDRFEGPLTQNYIDPAGISNGGELTTIVDHDQTTFEYVSIGKDGGQKSSMNTLNSHVCDSCGDSFDNRFSLFVHYSSDHDREMHKCITCRTIFEDRHVCPQLPECTAVIVNPLGQTGASFACCYCNEGHDSALNLQLHLARHASDEPVCGVCKATFDSEKELAEHHVRHSLNRIQYECNHCDEITNYRRDMVKHMAAHQGVVKLEPKMYQCSICRKTFSEKTQLVRHKKQQHMANASQTYFNATWGKKAVKEETMSVYVVQPEEEITIKQEPGSPGHHNSSPDSNSEAGGDDDDSDEDENYVVGKRGRPPKNKQPPAKKKGSLMPAFSCENCDLKFKGKVSLFIHYSSAHQREMHTCLFCRRIYEDRHRCPSVPDIAMEIVMPLREREKVELKCYYCSRVCSTKVDLQCHLVEHVNDPHVCSICQKECSSKDVLRVHYKRHTIDYRRIQFECQLCKKKFWTAPQIQDHIQAHKGFSFVCEHCGKSFMNRVSHRKHEHKHLIERGIQVPFQCEICDKTFPFLYELKKHKNRVHTVELDGYQTYNCTICGKNIPTKSGLARHMYHHKDKSQRPGKDDPERRFQCETCDKRFMNKYHLKSHMKIHTEEMPHQCNLCGKKSRLKYHHQLHMMTHVKGDNHQCDICGKWFSNHLYLEKHRDIHTEQTYPCKHCNKVFNTKTQLYKHRWKKHRGSSVNGDPRKLENDHLWLRALADLQSIKEEFEFAMNYIDSLKLWNDQEEKMKEGVISKLCTGQKHLIFVIYYMYLAIDKSPLTAFKYMKRIKDGDFSVDNFDEVADIFDQVYESRADDDFVNLTLDGLEDINLPLAYLLPSKDGNEFDPLDFDEASDDEIKSEDDMFEDPTSEAEAADMLGSGSNLTGSREDTVQHIEKVVHVNLDGQVKEVKVENKVADPKIGRTKKKKKKAPVKPKFGRKVGKKNYYDCTICRQTFTMKKMLFLHYSSVHKREMHMCIVCEAVFQDSHECPEMPDVTTEIANPLEEHGNTPLSCQYCGRVFATDVDLSDHLICHEGEDHTCTTCGKKYKNKETLERHFRYHQKLRRVRYMCNICPKVYWDKELVLSHVREHRGEKPFVCDMCGKSYQSKSIFKKHIKLHLFGIVKKFKCTVCSKAFRYEASLVKHAKNHSDVPHVCPVCGRKLPTLAGLNKHMFYHTGEAKKPSRKDPAVRYPCEECGSSYATPALLRYHMRLHTGDSPYVCKECGKICQNKQSYESHQRKHVKGERFQCEICDKSFVHSGSLRSHMDVHTNVTFTCRHCGLVFDVRSKLYKHVNRKHSQDAKPTKAYPFAVKNELNDS